VNNRVYNIYWSSNLAAGFTLIATNVPNGVFLDSAHTNHPAGFYKTSAELAPE
jgi:hypothetical protein